ncbi:MAG TPA: 6-phosphofructokinase [Flavobacteriales bacterium]
MGIEHIGILTSGGDAPGMNAAIRAAVRTAHFHGLKVSGVQEGYDGMIRGDIRPLGVRDVSNIIQRGGTILRSARSEEFRTVEGRRKAARSLAQAGIDGLVAVGGDGTFTGATFLEREHGVAIIGIPGTIDNDLGGTDITLGFDTATNTAVEAIDRIRDTASSHDRLFFVEVMGRTSGAIALQCGIAAGAEYVLVPERRESINDLIAALEQASTTKSSVIVIVAEGDEEGDAFTVARKVKERFSHYDTRVSVLGHLQRGGSPTVTDRVLASRLGVAAVEALRDGERGRMAGVVNGKVVLTPFAETIGSKRELSPELLRISAILAI